MNRKKLIYSLAFIFFTAILAGGVFLLEKEKTESAEGAEEPHDHQGHEHVHDESEENEADEEHITKLNEDQISKLNLEITEVGPDEIITKLQSQGKIVVKPDSYAHILTKMSGVAFDPQKNVGDLVKKGEILAIIESQEIADLKANYLLSLSKEKFALTTKEREESLFNKGISSKQEYLEAQSAAEEALINTLTTKQKLLSAGLEEDEIYQLSHAQNSNLKEYMIRSPFEGTVLARHITNGEYIENTTPIYEIGNLNTVWVEVGIVPNELHRIKKGQTVFVNSPYQQDFIDAAQVIFLSPTIEDETIMGKAIAELNNDSGTWRPGTLVNVAIEVDKEKVPLAVSVDAVQKIDGKNCLFIDGKNGFERKEVVLGRSDGKKVEVITGIESGARCVVNKSFLFKADQGKDSIEHED